MNSGFKYFPKDLYSKAVRISTQLPVIKAYYTAQVREVYYSVKDGNWNDPTVWETVSGRPNKTPSLTTDDVYVRTAVNVNANVSINNLFIKGTLTGTNSRTLSVLGDIQSSGVIDFTGVSTNLTLYGINNYVARFTSGTTSTITYARLGDQSIMDLSYRNLTTTGTGTKMFVAANTVTGILTVNGGILDISNYNLTVNGATNVNATLLNIYSSNVLFIGLVTLGNTAASKLLFTSNNVECRGGLSRNPSGTVTPGSGTWTFTTNNQSITTVFSTITFTAPVIISGAIIVTVTGSPNANTGNVLFNSSVNGDNASSTLKNSGSIHFGSTSPVIMTTGIFDYNYAGTYVGYVMTGNYTLPFTAYQGLYIAGGSTKTAAGAMTVGGKLDMSYTTLLLAGNATITGNTTLTGSVIDLSTYDITFSGTTALNVSNLTKTSSGNILFVGLLSLNNGAVALNFSGNPDIELRGGISGTNSVLTATGTPTLRFTTNNQTITTSLASLNFGSFSFLISGAITVTTSIPTPLYNIQVNGTIDGDNAASTFDNRTTGTGYFSYQNAQQPMLTNGVLQCNAAANIWKYNKAGAQDVTGSAYSTVEFGGSGNKTLQGNCTDTARSTTGTAVLVLNGFTIVP